MARTSTPWNLLPAKELGCGSATTCWRRLDEWARAGVFEQLQAALLDELGEAGRLDLERVLVDSASADKGYDYPRCRAELRRRGITPPASPGAAWSPRSGLAATAGGSSGRSPGCSAILFNTLQQPPW
jgi:hypothetical protein